MALYGQCQAGAQNIFLKVGETCVSSSESGVPTRWLIHEVHGRPAERFQPWCGVSSDQVFTTSFNVLCAGVLFDRWRMWSKNGMTRVNAESKLRSKGKSARSLWTRSRHAGGTNDDVFRLSAWYGRTAAVVSWCKCRSTRWWNWRRRRLESVGVPPACHRAPSWAPCCQCCK